MDGRRESSRDSNGTVVAHFCEGDRARSSGKWLQYHGPEIRLDTVGIRPGRICIGLWSRDRKWPLSKLFFFLLWFLNLKRFSPSWLIVSWRRSAKKKKDEPECCYTFSWACVTRDVCGIRIYIRKKNRRTSARHKKKKISRGADRLSRGSCTDRDAFISSAIVAGRQN